jgi:hypothetical protein
MERMEESRQRMELDYLQQIEQMVAAQHNT